MLRCGGLEISLDTRFRCFFDRQVCQPAPIDSEGSQAHQGAHQEANRSNVAVLFTLYIYVRHKAPGQGKEGEQTLLRG